MRYFIILLLFVVCFLAGTVFGIDRNQTSAPPSETMDNDIIVSEQNEEFTRNEAPPLEPANAQADIVDMEKSPTMMQKTASLLGSGVQNIFEMLASMLYQIAKAFF